MSNKPHSFRRKMRTETYTIPVNPDDVHAYTSEQTRLRLAVEALDEAQEDPGADVDKLQADVSRAREALDAKLADAGIETMTFTFRAMSPAKLEGLRADYPPTPAQWKAYEAARKVNDREPVPDVDEMRFVPALMAASCIKVEWSDGESQDGLSEEEAQDLCETSSTGDVRMFALIIGGVNNGPSLVSDLGKDSGAKRGSVPSPTTAAPAGSQPSSS